MTDTAIRLGKLVLRVLLRIIRAYGVWCLCLAALSFWPLLLVWIVCSLWRRRNHRATNPAPLLTAGNGGVQSFAA